MTSVSFSRAVMAWALVVLLLGVLTDQALGLPGADPTAAAALLAYLAAALPGLGRGARLFLAVCLTLAASVAYFVPNPAAALLGAMGRAGFVCALFVALGFLREAARSSLTVRRAGLFLAAQPPGRRYLALTFGGHLFGLVLNYGSISLLGTMAERSTVSERDEVIRALRLRRMLLAVQRGFIATLAWSPLTLSLAFTLHAFPNVGWVEVLPLLLANGFGLLALGWGLDALFKPPPRPGGYPKRPPTDPRGWLDLLKVAGLVVVIFSLGFVLHQASGIRLVVAVMLLVPPTAALWMAAQFATRGQRRPPRLTGRRLVRHAREAFPSYRQEIALLGSAGFIGGAAGSLLALVLPHASAAPLAGLPWLLPVLCVWVVPLAGQLGMNPILSVALITAFLPTPESLGPLAPVFVVALTGGWALTGASSPFTATTLLTGRLGGVSASRVGLAWNGVYTLVGGVLVSLYVALLAVLAAG